MNKIPLEKLDLDVCYEKLESGLEVFVVPISGKKQVYASLTTKFGSKIQDFVPVGKNKMIKVPLGVAHFLEHQKFHMEDGSDPMAYFDGSGTEANAYTDQNETTYLFSGVNNALENLEYLLHYVASPYFTDESVEKEKGIIIEELKMYDDNPYQKLFQKSLFNTFKYVPSRYPVIGTIADIKKTTKEDLMTCYETFYHPSNMFLIVVGNIDPIDVIKIARKSELNQKHMNDTVTIKVKDYKETPRVDKEMEVLPMDVSIPKIAINYKLALGQFDAIERKKIQYYLSIIFENKFGSTSLFIDELRNDKVITDLPGFFPVNVGNYMMYVFNADTKEYDEFLKRFTHEMENLDITEEEFERKRKTLISGYIYVSDNVTSIAKKLNRQIIEYGKVLDDEYSLIKSLNCYEMKEYIKKLSFKNRSIVIIDHEKKNDDN